MFTTISCCPAAASAAGRSLHGRGRGQAGPGSRGYPQRGEFRESLRESSPHVEVDVAASPAGRLSFLLSLMLSELPTCFVHFPTHFHAQPAL